MGVAGGRASHVGHRSKNIGKVTGLDITKKIITEARLPVGALIMSNRMDGKNDAVSSSVRCGIARKARGAHLISTASGRASWGRFFLGFSGSLSHAEGPKGGSTPRREDSLTTLR